MNKEEIKEEKLEEEEKISKHKSKKYEEKIAELDEKVLSLEEEVAKWKNKYYEAYADLDNTRKMLNKDREEMIKYRAMGFIENILPTLDNFEMAFKVESDDPKIKNYQTGFKMILNQFKAALENEKVSMIEPKIGDEFDPKMMSAMSVVKGEEDNKIADVYLKGYVLKDRMIRPALVIVSKKEIEEPEKEKEKEEE